MSGILALVFLLLPIDVPISDDVPKGERAPKPAQPPDAMPKAERAPEHHRQRVEEKPPWHGGAGALPDEIKNRINEQNAKVSVTAQDAKSTSTGTAAMSTDMSSLVNFTQWLTVLLLIAMLLLVIVVAIPFYYTKKSWEDSPRAWQLVGVVVILFLVVILVVAGYSGAQLAAISGIFGTALGYLFGKGTAKDHPQA